MSSRRKLVSGDDHGGDGSRSGWSVPFKSDRNRSRNQNRSSNVLSAPDEELGFVPVPPIVSSTSYDDEESSFLIPICSYSSESGCFLPSREEEEESSFLVPICSMSSSSGDNYKLGKIDSPGSPTSSAGDDHELGEIDSPGSAGSASYDHSWYRPNFLKRMRSHDLAVLDCDFEGKFGIRAGELGKFNYPESASSDHPQRCPNFLKRMRFDDHDPDPTAMDWDIEELDDDDDDQDMKIMDLQQQQQIQSDDHYKLMESFDFNTLKHKALTLKANLDLDIDLGSNNSLLQRLESLVNLNEMMNRWSKLEEGDLARLELTMAELIQESRYS